MYFNDSKENTNIDDQFDKKVSFDFGKFKFPLIIIGGIILLLIIIFIVVSLTKNRTKYFITLEGNQEMTIYQGTTYNEPGYSGFDSKNNTYEVTVSGEVDATQVGTYTITYSLKNVTKTRTVNVIAPPEVLTIIHLNGEKNMYLKVGETYEEPGYSAVDYIDGDLTNEVIINGSVDTTKAGTYRIVYSVVNSSDVTTSETRVVIVE